MKHAFEKQITVGLLAAMLVASPVFAETATTMSEPIGLKKKPVSTTSKGRCASGTEQWYGRGGI